jgi:hypothetical protein
VLALFAFLPFLSPLLAFGIGCLADDERAIGDLLRREIEPPLSLTLDPKVVAV